MELESSSSQETFDRTRRDSQLCDAVFAEFRALCHRINRENHMPPGLPTTSEGFLDLLREACARTTAALAEAVNPDADPTSNISVELFLAIRKAEGFKIEAHNAEVTWWHTETDDPYGIDEVPEEYQQIGRQYFARAPGSDIWVCFDDLPNETSEALWEAHEHEPVFPAGVPRHDPRDGGI